MSDHDQRGVRHVYVRGRFHIILSLVSRRAYQPRDYNKNHRTPSEFSSCTILFGNDFQSVTRLLTMKSSSVFPFGTSVLWLKTIREDKDVSGTLCPSVMKNLLKA